MDFLALEDLHMSCVTSKVWFNLVIWSMQSRFRGFGILIREFQEYNSAHTLGKVSFQRWKELASASNEIERCIVVFQYLLSAMDKGVKEGIAIL